ncbi:MAG: tetratricopeptide repeat protein, partial [Rhodoferax sp.]|nr:tetratricopeptide repeat protein [Rhodoferax sp.]
PLAFNTRLDSIPKAEGYLACPPAKRQAWGARLGSKTRPRIGLAWSGFTRHKNDRKRSIPLADLLAYLPPGYDYVSLQKEVRDSDQAALQASGIRHFGDAIQDFSDTAALVDWVDVVVSVDTSVAHLSGALGKTTWVLLPYIPDWRWLLERPDSVWYASVRLFRQGADRQWAGVLQRVAQALPAYVQTLAPAPPAAQEHDAKAHCQHAVELIGSQQYAAALLSCERAIALDPDYLDAYGNKGVALQGLNRFAEALLCYDHVIAAKPDYAHAHCNRGIVFQELMRMEDAVISLNRAIALRPDFASAHWNKAITLLLHGHYPEGWALYEWGWPIHQRGTPRNFAQPLWKGAESLAGKTILLHAEQGIGDAIQFSRYAPLVSA